VHRKRNFAHPEGLEPPTF